MFWLRILINPVFKDERTKILASFSLLLRKCVFCDAPIAFTSAPMHCIFSSSGNTCLCAQSKWGIRIELHFCDGTCTREGILLMKVSSTF